MPASIAEYIPQFASDNEARGARRRAWTAWIGLTAGAVLFLGIVMLAPWARANGHDFVAWTIYRGFSAACHQMPERSFHLFGFPLAVCARCFGLYAGVAAGIFLYPLVRSLDRLDAPVRGWLLAAALPTTVDFALGFFGIWPNTHLSRFVTASLLGAVAAFYIVPGILQLSRMKRRSLSGARPSFSG